MKQKFFIILDGPMGAGKTSVTKLLRTKLSRTAIVGWDTTKAIISDFGTGAEDGKTLVSIQSDLVKSLIGHGMNIVMDAGFSRGGRMLPFIKIAKQKGYSLHIYQFTAPHKVLLERAVDRPKFDWEKKKISKANIIKNIHFYNENKYTGQATLIDSNLLSTTQIASLILKDIRDK